MLLKIKYQLLVIYLKNLTRTQNLVKLKKKITDHVHDKYITITEFNMLTAENFAPRLTQANLVKTLKTFKTLSLILQTRKILKN